jgi:hypothetical protein
MIPLKHFIVLYCNQTVQSIEDMLIDLSDQKYVFEKRSMFLREIAKYGVPHQIEMREVSDHPALYNQNGVLFTLVFPDEAAAVLAKIVAGEWL